GQIRQMRERGWPYSEVAVLYRLHAQSRILEEMLVRANIPYRVYGGTRFYDRKEIKDILAYLRVIVNPSDTVSLKRIINVPRRSIGDTTVSQLEAQAMDEGVPMFSVLTQPSDDLSSRAKKCVLEFAKLIFDLMNRQDQKPLDEFIQDVLNETGLINQMDKEPEEAYVTRKENLLEFIGAAHEYLMRADEEDRNLQAFLENVALITDLDRQEEAPQFVTLMTLHSAKGLEYDAVFMAGMEENVFPSYRAINEDDRLEEERRLAYVGITRARKQLCMSLARQRTIFNQVSYNRPSRFIGEIPKRLIEDMLEMTRQHFGNEQTELRRPHNREVRHIDFGTPGMGQLNIPGVTKGIVPSQASRLSGSAMMKMYQPGDRVMHRKFGEGTVLSVEKAGTDARITINFLAYGTKEFSLAIAPIFKIEE
ncbi:MAG: ATP-binding domain-containing protein, partial [Clostridia bacterium]|nr:ATP-binding domain-containing protein [Clostridia bacterium]